jgi:hypothetical protein
MMRSRSILVFSVRLDSITGYHSITRLGRYWDYQNADQRKSPNRVGFASGDCCMVPIDKRKSRISSEVSKSGFSNYPRGSGARKPDGAASNPSYEQETVLQPED